MAWRPGRSWCGAMVATIVLSGCGGDDDGAARAAVERAVADGGRISCLPGSGNTWWEHVETPGGEVFATGDRCEVVRTNCVLLSDLTWWEEVRFTNGTEAVGSRCTPDASAGDRPDDPPATSPRKSQVVPSDWQSADAPTTTAPAGATSATSSTFPDDRSGSGTVADPFVLSGDRYGFDDLDISFGTTRYAVANGYPDDLVCLNVEITPWGRPLDPAVVRDAIRAVGRDGAPLEPISAESDLWPGSEVDLLTSDQPLPPANTVARSLCFRLDEVSLRDGQLLAEFRDDVYEARRS